MPLTKPFDITSRYAGLTVDDEEKKKLIYLTAITAIADNALPPIYSDELPDGDVDLDDLLEKVGPDNCRALYAAVRKYGNDWPHLNIYGSKIVGVNYRGVDHDPVVITKNFSLSYAWFDEHKDQLTDSLEKTTKIRPRGKSYEPKSIEPLKGVTGVTISANGIFMNNLTKDEQQVVMHSSKKRFESFSKSYLRYFKEYLDNSQYDTFVKALYCSIPLRSRGTFMASFLGDEYKSQKEIEVMNAADKSKITTKRVIRYTPMFNSPEIGKNLGAVLKKEGCEQFGKILERSMQVLEEGNCDYINIEETIVRANKELNITLTNYDIIERPTFIGVPTNCTSILISGPNDVVPLCWNVAVPKALYDQLLAKWKESYKTPTDIMYMQFVGKTMAYVFGPNLPDYNTKQTLILKLLKEYTPRVRIARFSDYDQLSLSNVLYSNWSIKQWEELVEMWHSEVEAYNKNQKMNNGPFLRVVEGEMLASILHKSYGEMCTEWVWYAIKYGIDPGDDMLNKDSEDFLYASIHDAPIELENAREWTTFADQVRTWMNSVMARNCRRVKLLSTDISQTDYDDACKKYLKNFFDDKTNKNKFYEVYEIMSQNRVRKFFTARTNKNWPPLMARACIYRENDNFPTFDPVTEAKILITRSTLPIEGRAFYDFVNNQGKPGMCRGKYGIGLLCGPTLADNHFGMGKNVISIRMGGKYLIEGLMSINSPLYELINTVAFAEANLDNYTRKAGTRGSIPLVEHVTTVMQTNGVKFVGYTDKSYLIQDNKQTEIEGVTGMINRLKDASGAVVDQTTQINKIKDNFGKVKTNSGLGNTGDFHFRDIENAVNANKVYNYETVEPIQVAELDIDDHRSDQNNLEFVARTRIGEEMEVEKMKINKFDKGTKRRNNNLDREEFHKKMQLNVDEPVRFKARERSGSRSRSNSPRRHNNDSGNLSDNDAGSERKGDNNQEGVPKEKISDLFSVPPKTSTGNDNPQDEEKELRDFVKQNSPNKAGARRADGWEYNQLLGLYEEPVYPKWTVTVTKNSYKLMPVRPKDMSKGGYVIPNVRDDASVWNEDEIEIKIKHIGKTNKTLHGSHLIMGQAIVSTMVSSNHKNRLVQIYGKVLKISPKRSLQYYFVEGALRTIKHPDHIGYGMPTLLDLKTMFGSLIDFSEAMVGHYTSLKPYYYKNVCGNLYFNDRTGISCLKAFNDIVTMLTFIDPCSPAIVMYALLKQKTLDEAVKKLMLKAVEIFDIDFDDAMDNITDYSISVQDFFKEVIDYYLNVDFTGKAVATSKVSAEVTYNDAVDYEAYDYMTFKGTKENDTSE